MTSPPGDFSAGSPAEQAPAARARTHPIRAFVRACAFLAWTLYCLAGVLVSRARRRDAFGKRAASLRWAHRWLVGCARIMGIRIAVHGESPPSGTMLAPNHLGYLDIVALGVAHPAFYVVKAEAASWPLFGTLIRHSESIPIRRGLRRDVAAVREKIMERLESGQSVCAFLEGTSTGGDRVLPFHASLVAPALDGGFAVVPVALAWRTRGAGLSVSHDVAYWGDHVLLTHMWRVLGLSGIEVDVVFGTPVTAAGRDRKEVAAELRREVIRMLRERGVGVEEA